LRPYISGSFKFLINGKTELFIALIAKMSSRDPAAAKVCPIVDLFAHM
jgi:hypothetical protein